MEQRIVGCVGVRAQSRSQWRPATKPAGDQGRRVFARQPAQPAGDFPDDPMPVHIRAQGAAKRLGDLPRSTECIIHHETPVHDKHDPQCGLSRRVCA